MTNPAGMEFPESLENLTPTQIDLLLEAQIRCSDDIDLHEQRYAMFTAATKQLDRSATRRKIVMASVIYVAFMAVVTAGEFAQIFAHTSITTKFLWTTLMAFVWAAGTGGLLFGLREFEVEYRRQIASLSKHGEGCRCKSCDANFKRKCMHCETTDLRNLEIRNANTVLTAKMETMDRKIREGRFVDVRALESAKQSVGALSEEDRQSLEYLSRNGSQSSTRVATGMRSYGANEMPDLLGKNVRSSHPNGLHHVPAEVHEGEIH